MQDDDSVTAAAVDLRDYGWSDARIAQLADAAHKGLEPARVLAEHRSGLRVVCARGERDVTVAGRLRHVARQRGQLPCVGDWVLIDAVPLDAGAMVHAVLPRSSRFSRGTAGRRDEEQVVAANIDVVWLANALDQPLGARRLDRFLAAAWDSGASPVVLLTKRDIAQDLPGALASAAEVARGVPIHAVSGVTGEGLDTLRPYLAPGRTVAILGASGAGKSTLINRLAGEELLRVGTVREGDAKGRHTTTHRQLIRLGSGGMIVDTPGIRELQLWEADEGVRDTFGDIEELAAQCRFADCVHDSEPGCAVLAAIAGGTLEAARLDSYHKLQRELAHLERRNDARAQAEEERRLRPMMKSLRHHPKYR